MSDMAPALSRSLGVFEPRQGESDTQQQVASAGRKTRGLKVDLPERLASASSRRPLVGRHGHQDGGKTGAEGLQRTDRQGNDEVKRLDLLDQPRSLRGGSTHGLDNDHSSSGDVASKIRGESHREVRR